MVSGQLDAKELLASFARRLSEWELLTQGDLAAVAALANETTTHPRGADLTSEIDVPRIVLAGWACQMRPHAKRRRQIFGFLLPGDVIGSFWRKPEFIFCQTIALTQLQTVSAQSLLVSNAAGGLRHGALVAAARRAEDHAHHLLLNHIMRLGGRDAYEGLAHLLLELHGRLASNGLAPGGEFQVPVGQRVLAQVMGFSVAHTNHTLQRMVADGLFETRGDVFHLLQPEKMALIAEFSIDGPDTSSREERHERTSQYGAAPIRSIVDATERNLRNA